MERHREPVSYHWEGPLPQRDLPDEVLYDVVLRLHHGAGEDAPQTLERSLGSLAKQTRLHRLPFLGARLNVKDDKWRMTGVMKNGELRLRLHNRLKGKSLSRLVAALSALPEARDLRIQANRERYCRPFESVGPCSPCAAGRFGAGRS